MEPFESLYYRTCRSPIWLFEVGDSSLLGPKIIYEKFKKVRMIKDRLETTYSQKKSYAKNKRRYLDSKQVKWCI